MKGICLCFQVHHSFHFQTYRFLDIGSNKSYFDDLRIEREINEAAINYYLPSNNFLLKLINKYKGKLKMAFELAGNLNRLNSEENEINTNSFISLLNNLNKEEPLLNIYLDYKSLGGFGIEKKEKFIQKLVSQIIRRPDMNFILPSEIAERYGPVAEINTNEPICWLNNFHSYYYPGNELQTEAIKQLYMLYEMADNIEDLNLQKDWQYLQTTDHIHLMDDQHPVYNGDGISNCIYKTKYDAFINFMNILDDFRLKLQKASKKKEKKAPTQVQNKNRKHTTPTRTTNNLRSKE